MLTSLIPIYLQQLETTLQSFLDEIFELNEIPNELTTMLRYPMGWVDADNQPHQGKTGKRIRPTLLLMCCQAAGGDWQQALPAAAAVELLHNFSLIHDDIEDNSQIRHGRPTVWSVWGLSQGINTGDAMFTLSYEALSRLTQYGVSDDIVLRCWQVFNHTTLDLTRGQHLDIAFETRPVVSVDDYLSMILGKTASLVGGSAQLGALIGSRNEEISRYYAEFGLNLGLAFQLHDDILGIWGDPDVTGKSAATDIRDQKKSLPVLYGLERSPRMRELYQSQSLTASDIEEIVTELDTVGARADAEERELVFYERATHALESAGPTGDAAEGLHDLMTQLLKRTF